MDRGWLRQMIKWNQRYRSEWDFTPDLYVESGFVSWGKSKRLGLLAVGNVKAYIGVQHVDPGMAGWAIVEQPQARYFASLFINGRVVTLKSFSNVDSVLDWLSEAAQWQQ